MVRRMMPTSLVRPIDRLSMANERWRNRLKTRLRTTGPSSIVATSVCLLMSPGLLPPGRDFAVTGEASAIARRSDGDRHHAVDGAGLTPHRSLASFGLGVAPTR